jgi:TetR/AcrR family transcriptional repressor of nem operon
VATVMADAGLTHGAFYSHFGNKDQLSAAALEQALSETRRRWIGNVQDRSWSERLQRLAIRYLRRGHRDNLKSSCAFAAVGSDAGRAGLTLRSQYEKELQKTLDEISAYADDGMSSTERLDDSIALMALCVGGLILARAVPREAMSTRILNACKNASARLVAAR